MPDCRNFILCRDRAEARRIRRIVAERGVGFNTQVGTWLELVQAALEAYLLSPPEDVWQDALNQSMTQLPDAFWAGSLAVAPTETTAALNAELDRLLRALEPGVPFELPNDHNLSDRALRHLADMVQLHQSMGGLLPNDLMAADSVLQATPADALRLIRVTTMESLEVLPPWQAGLIRKLNDDSSAAGSSPLDSLLPDLTFAPGAENSTALGLLQRDLYGRHAAIGNLDASLQWLGARDYLEEVEVVAGMIQRMLAENPNLRMNDLALLLPSNSTYSAAIREVFGHAGLPVSGLSSKQRSRDLGRELIFYLLQTLRKPAPTMAMAAFVTSPLLPWSRVEGFELAAELMGGNYGLEKVERPFKTQNETLDAVRSGVDTVADLRSLLTKFPKWLDPSAEYEAQKRQAGDLSNSLLQSLEGDAIPWDQLMALTAPRPEAVETAGDLTREGIAVFYEREEPWRQVKTLYVLGLNNGHYPREANLSPVFSEADVHVLQQQGYKLESSVDCGSRLRALFARQLCSVTENIHFLLSRRDAYGKELAPSSSLSFMAQLFGRGAEPEELILELDSAEGRRQAAGLALAPPMEPAPAREIESSDLRLESNLLEIRKREDGSLRPQSPSSLENLMTSPLAWLLNRAGLEPSEWAPESLDVMAKGSLAHAVFERLFAPGKPLPSADEVQRQVPILLREVVIATMPFLNRPEWKVERNHLEKEILQAASRWQEVLETIGAKVLGVEVWLTGSLDEQPIHGSADQLMELPDGRIYVIDYKKSSSKKRKDRMTKGYDSQASLYRIMLQTGTASFRSSDGTKVSIEQDREIGALYYLMNDQVALADTDQWLENSLRDFEELGADVAVNALPLIRERLVQVAKGQVFLNRESDESWYEKNAGMPLYALDNSPLIRMFMLPGEEGE